MRYLYLFSFFILVLAGPQCTKRAVDAPLDVSSTIQESLARAKLACDPTSIIWLEDIISKAEEDLQTNSHKGNYLGSIYLTTYKNRPVFYIRMSLGSGGIAAHIYDCYGKSVSVDNGDVGFEQSGSNRSLIYTNVPMP